MAFSPHYDVDKTLSTSGSPSFSPTYNNWRKRKIAYARMGADSSIGAPYQAVAYKDTTNSWRLHYSKDTFSDDWLGRSWSTKVGTVELDDGDSLDLCATTARIYFLYKRIETNERLFVRHSGDAFRDYQTITTPYATTTINNFCIVPGPDGKYPIVLFVQGNRICAFSPTNRFDGFKILVLSYTLDSTEIYSIDALTQSNKTIVFIATAEGLFEATLSNGTSSTAHWEPLSRISSRVYDHVRCSIRPTGRKALVTYKAGSYADFYVHDSGSWSRFVWTSSSSTLQNAHLLVQGNKFYILYKRSSSTKLLETAVTGDTLNPTFVAGTSSILNTDPIGHFTVHKSVYYDASPALTPDQDGMFRDIHRPQQVAWMVNNTTKAVKVYPAEAAPRWTVTSSAQSPDLITTIEPGAVISYAWVKQNDGGIDVEERSSVSGRGLKQELLIAAERNDVVISYPVQAGYTSRTPAPHGTVVRYDLSFSAPGTIPSFGVLRGDGARFNLYDISGVIQGLAPGSSIIDDDLVVGISSRYTFWQIVPLADGTMVLIRAYTSDDSSGLRWAVYRSASPQELREWEFWNDFNSVKHPYWSDFGEKLPALAPAFNYFPGIEDKSSGIVFHVKENPAGTLRQESRDQVFYYLDLSQLSEV